MSEYKLGQIYEKGEVIVGFRDAFHVPAIVASSYDRVYPGDMVKFVDEECKTVVGCDVEEAHGIVDPWADNSGDGKLFWVLLKPGMTNKLSHNFEVSFEKPLNDSKKYNYEYVRDYVREEDDGCRGC